jgi:hypothetical protein
VGSRHRQRGKAFELCVGRMFGGRRRRSGEGTEFDDCVQQDGSPLPVSLECKSYEKLQLRQSWIDQAIRNSHGRPWVVVQRPRGSRRIFATCDIAFLLSLVKQAGVIPGEETDGRATGAG